MIVIILGQSGGLMNTMSSSSSAAAAAAAATSSSIVNGNSASAVSHDDPTAVYDMDSQHVTSDYFEKVLNQWRQVTSPDSEEGTLNGIPGEDYATTTHDGDDENQHGRALRRLEILLDKAGVPHKFSRDRQTAEKESPQSAANSISPGRKSYMTNLQQQLKTDSLPTELKRCRPLNRSDFMARLKTFSSRTWFGKPDSVNAIRCARYGWINIGVDELYCTSCHAHAFFKSTSGGSAATLQEEATEFRRELTRGHRKHCPWNVNPCPSSFGQLRPVPGTKLIQSTVQRGQRIRSYLERLAAERQKDKLTELIKLHPGISKAIQSLRSIFSESVTSGNLGSQRSNMSTVRLFSRGPEAQPVCQQGSFRSELSNCVEQLRIRGITSLDEVLLLITLLRWLTSRDSDGRDKFLDALKRYTETSRKGTSAVVSDSDIGERELSIADLGSCEETCEDLLFKEAAPEVLALFGWDVVTTGTHSPKGLHALVCHWCQQTYSLAELLQVSYKRRPSSDTGESRGLESSRYLKAAAAALSACDSASSVSRFGKTGRNSGHSMDSESSATFHPLLEHRACCPWVVRKGVNPIAFSVQAAGHAASYSPHFGSSCESFDNIEEATLSALKSVSRAAMGAMDLERLVQYSDRAVNGETCSENNAETETDANLFSDLDEDEDTPSQRVFREFQKRHDVDLRTREMSLTPRKRSRDSSRYSYAPSTTRRDSDEVVKYSPSSAWISGWLAYTLAIRQAFYQDGLPAAYAT
eukprot:gb/GECG01011111.1/.p1 GENE.gb/GECG01011111.1/~~gb/GECG01011111.1/.p1  ORF type:complete len:753 (+),score=82.30 gb/GECG01011111.1/:1-2259(+)